ncbi:hypothetical protein Golob_017838 [Gossypium lobatum]|uniref:Reverse transcriptase zinc-binding domain-containing protein n=1 Tax=Gossypium lobatum TaxID=34289 RepID=A0A7J8M8B5_9ROSI|nr:hypothetical protein [Gossypium lobatum]
MVVRQRALSVVDIGQRQRWSTVVNGGNDDNPTAMMMTSIVVAVEVHDGNNNLTTSFVVLGKSPKIKIFDFHPKDPKTTSHTCYSLRLSHDDSIVVHGMIDVELMGITLFKMRDDLTQFQSMFSDPNTASESKIWDEVREKMCKVLWHELIWLPLHIPKHAVVTWMVILGRIRTKDKVVQLGIINDGQCKLCNSEIDKGNYSGLLGVSRKNVIKDNLRGSREMRVRS